jgi:hypothetical protein
MSEALRGPAAITPAIFWPLALVASVHLLTTPGQWLVTDQAEYILVADRLLERGSLHLAEAGETPRVELPWVTQPLPGQPQRSRLLPLTSIVLLPFVAADRLAASSLPPASRPLVHLQGHVFVLAGLGVMALALVRRGASDSTIAVTVVLTGLAWPIWQVSRRGGPEPVFVLLVALFLLGQALREGGAFRQGLLAMALVCALLPWGNPTGLVLGGALLVGAAAEDAWTGGSPRALAIPAATWAVSTGAVILLWNHGYHGDWRLGGYAPYHSATGSVVDAASVWSGLRLHLEAIVVYGAPLIAVALAGGALGSGRERVALCVPVALVASMIMMFAAFPQPEPARRIAAAWPALGGAAGRAILRARWPVGVRQVLVALGAVVGFHGFWSAEGRYFEGGGFFYPSVLWVRLWIREAPAWQFLVPSAALLILLIVAASNTSRQLARDEVVAGG